MKGIECVGAILGGMVLGCTLGMLFAPKSGERTRAEIKNFFEDEIEKYRDKCHAMSERLKQEVDEMKKAVAQEMAK
ncbi:MAG: YtxH domain-containing protein [Rikenellaceae bacterium]|nr:YtxH domain-containing protein [Rikenellaceae bacterium]